jgi:hypothetical protein
MKMYSTGFIVLLVNKNERRATISKKTTFYDMVIFLCLICVF